MEFLAFAIVGGFILFLIITWAVKIAVKEALTEVKEEIIEEFNLRKEKENSDDSPQKEK
ncbi:MAG: hypothetical protein K0R92_1507 [Lachnospiraceae bacterium]|jgi:hypothetical protein|nr:hypothetical protein [Anaerocolumna sp.]MDF2610033.1 hypothetical protein [Lachnospiraceae bacterium]